MSDNIRKVSQLYDERDQTWFDVYEVYGVENKPIQVPVPRETREPSNIRKLLLRAGGNVPLLEHCRSEIILASEIAAPIVTRAGQTGWRDDGRCFVTHSHIEGSSPEGSVLPPKSSIAGAAGGIGIRGNLEDWQALIAVAPHSTAMMVALCAAFAAPLLGLLQIPNFGLVLVAPSRAGKTQAQLVGASVIGFGEEEHLPTLNATPAGLMESGLIFNDHMLPINEVGTARGGKGDVHFVMRDVTYTFMSGRETVRHSSWGGNTASPSSFKVLLLLSSEHSPDDWAARGGETRDDGETARLIGLPVLRDGHQTVFDQPPDLDEEELQNWITMQFQKLRLGLPEQRGQAFRAYMREFFEDRETYIEYAQGYVTQFKLELARYANNRIKGDIVAKFGVLAAGGILAIYADVLPFDAQVVWRAMRRACRAALDCLPDPEADLHTDLLTLREQLTGAGMIDVENASTAQKRLMHSAEGYYEKEITGVKYTFRSVCFTKFFRSQARARRVLDWLDEEGFLHHQRDRKVGVSNEWAQVQVKWPDGSRVRSICVFLTDPDVLDVLG